MPLDRVIEAINVSAMGFFSKRACLETRVPDHLCFDGLSTVSSIALKLLYPSSGIWEIFRHADLIIDCADDVAFQAKIDLTFAFSIFGSFLDIGKRRFRTRRS